MWLFCCFAHRLWVLWTKGFFLLCSIFLVWYYTYVSFTFWFNPPALKRKVAKLEKEWDQATVRERGQIGSVSRFYKLAFLYCLSSCVAAAEESVAFSEGSLEVSTRGQITTQNKVNKEIAWLTLYTADKLRETISQKDVRQLSFKTCLWLKKWIAVWFNFRCLENTAFMYNLQ